MESLNIQNWLGFILIQRRVCGVNPIGILSITSTGKGKSGSMDHHSVEVQGLNPVCVETTL